MLIKEEEDWFYDIEPQIDKPSSFVFIANEKFEPDFSDELVAYNTRILEAERAKRERDNINI